MGVSCDPIAGRRDSRPSEGRHVPVGGLFSISSGGIQQLFTVAGLERFVKQATSLDRSIDLRVRSFWCGIGSRRMLAISKKPPPQVDGPRPVHFQPFDRGPSRRRPALDPQEIGAPTEMIAPSLLSRVEQRHELTGLRINSIYVIVFVIIASRAAKGHIAQLGRPPRNAGQDMVQRKAVIRSVFLRISTVITAETG